MSGKEQKRGGTETMIVTNKHYKLIERIASKWTEGHSLERILDELSEDDLEYLTHLELSGLVVESETGFELTQAGHQVAEALRECYQMVEKEDDNFRLLSSEIISMIDVARLAQGDVSAQPQIARELERRGMVQDGKLLPVAEFLLHAYEMARPVIHLSPELSAKLRKMPPGPGKKALLDLTREEIHRLESMRLLTFSLPEGMIYSLTGVGQQIRAGLLKGAVVDFALTGEMISALLEEAPDSALKEKMEMLGMFDDNGALTPAGRHFKLAAQLLTQPIVINPSIDIEENDFVVLTTIDDLWKTYRKNPEIYPSYKQIKEKLNAIGKGEIVPTYGLYLLESYRLITTRTWQNGEVVYELTDWGRTVLNDRKRHSNKPVFSTAIMAITTTRMENLSPDDHWVQTAEEQSIVGKGFPTNSGRLFAQLASGIERYPVVSAWEGKVLRALPLWRGMFETTLLRQFAQAEHEQVKYALRKLVSQGIVDALPGNLYKLTTAGEYFKRALGHVPPGMEFQVTPHVLQLLEVAKKWQERGGIDWKKVEKEITMARDTYMNAITLARKLLFLKNDKISTSGEILLEGLAILHKAKTSWEEIDV